MVKKLHAENTVPEWSYFHLFFKKNAKVMNCKFRRLDTLVLDTENTLKIKNDAAYAPVKLESTQTPPGTGDGILAVFLSWSFRVELHKWATYPTNVNCPIFPLRRSSGSTIHSFIFLLAT